jgi:hypothetical protein
MATPRLRKLCAGPTGDAMTAVIKRYFAEERAALGDLPERLRAALSARGIDSRIDRNPDGSNPRLIARRALPMESVEFRADSAGRPEVVWTDGNFKTSRVRLSPRTLESVADRIARAVADYAKS